MALITTPDGTYWVDDEVLMQATRSLEDTAARLMRYIALEVECRDPGPYPGRATDEALMAEVLAMEDES